MILDRETESDLDDDVAWRDDGRPNEGGRVALFTILGLVLVLGLGYLGVAAYAGDRVPRGARVDGIRIGGLRPAGATSRLLSVLGPRAARPIVFAYAGHTFRVDPAAAGLTVDYAASVADAGGERTLDPQRLWDFFTGGHDSDPVVSVNPAQLGAELDKISTAVNRPARNGTVEFRKGRAVPVTDRGGLTVERGPLAAALRQAFLAKSDPGTLQLPVQSDPAYISNDAVDRAMDAFANPAVSGPVVLLVGDQRVRVAPRIYLPYLSLVPVGRQLLPKVAAKGLIARIQGLVHGTGARTRPASIRLVGGTPKVTPGRMVVKFNVADFARNFATYAARPPGERVMPVHAVIREPRLTTAQITGLGIHTRIATASFTLGRASSGQLAAQARRLQNRLLRPGAVLRLPVDARSAAGQAVATAAFQAALSGGLGIVDHQAHASYTPSFPAGQEAVALTVRNTSRYGVLVGASASGHTVTVTLWSTSRARISWHTGVRYDLVAPTKVTRSSRGCTPSAGQPGFRIDVTRTSKPLLRGRGHGPAMHDRVTTAYAPTAGVRCRR